VPVALNTPAYHRLAAELDLGFGKLGFDEIPSTGASLRRCFGTTLRIIFPHIPSVPVSDIKAKPIADPKIASPHGNHGILCRRH